MAIATGQQYSRFCQHSSKGDAGKQIKETSPAAGPISSALITGHAGSELYSSQWTSLPAPTGPWGIAAVSGTLPSSRPLPFIPPMCQQYPSQAQLPLPTEQFRRPSPPAPQPKQEQLYSLTRCLRALSSYILNASKG